MYNIELKIAVNIQIQNSDIDNILTTCFEGGSEYWIHQIKVVDNDHKGQKYASDVISNNGKLQIITYEGTECLLTKVKLVKGIESWLKNYYYSPNKTKYGSDIESEFHLINWDAGDSDIILQYALFDKVVYG